MPDRFEDHRGVIQDILAGPIDQVTEITTMRGKIRGNHIHHETHQWTYIVSGWLRMIVQYPDGVQEKVVGPGQLVHEPPGVPHAWRAVEDCKVLVFTRGPRSGEAYESDTVRLENPILV